MSKVIERYVKITFGNSVIIPLSDIDDFLDNAQPGDIYQIEIVELTEKDFENLPEFTGF